MYSSTRERLERLIEQAGHSAINSGLKGLEKESLRVTQDGRIAQTEHPRALGSALTHPSITTDYSEALLEFITPPMPSATQTLAALEDIHRFVYSVLEDELLWATSMPCVVGGDKSIPIARYGSSNVGFMKHVYRRGLDYRYGRSMQAISGVHFNYSLPEAFWEAWRTVEGDPRPLQTIKSDGYFRMIRNFQRFGWLIPYLFGASPAVCKSFFLSPRDDFDSFDDYTYYLPYATSLRMSDIGYKNRAQADLKVSYDSLESYLDSLTHAIETPDPEYLEIGVKVDGEYRQLNANILQIENEYYSFVRPKNVTQSGEKPSIGLRRRGVHYVEIRALDVNAFDPVGVAATQLYFIEALLIFCILHDSPVIGAREQREIDQNQALVAREGRRPGLTLMRDGHAMPLPEWGLAIGEALLPICQVLDQDAEGAPYTEAVRAQLLALQHPEQTPSARALTEMRKHSETFVQFAMRLSRQHAAYFHGRPLPEAQQREMERIAAESLAEQAALETQDELSFDQYLERYFAQRA